MISFMLPQVFEDFIYQVTNLAPETLKNCNVSWKKMFCVPLQSTKELCACTNPV